MEENITLEGFASLYGISAFVAILVGLAVKPALVAWKGDTWKWYIPVLNGFSALIGALVGTLAFGLVSNWDPNALFLGFVNGVYAAAAARGLYEMQRSRLE